MEGQAAPLGRQVEVGEISEDAWADGYADIEERLGGPEAFQAREEARDALLAWGLAHARALWGRHGRLFPGQPLANVEALLRGATCTGAPQGSSCDCGWTRERPAIPSVGGGDGGPVWLPREGRVLLRGRNA